jgi:NADPH-dependent 2,4-dienoyl-CoA reductase/sulfur reductase-like enzyme
MSAPANPFRCPPGPYERASLIANYLKTKKPKSKLILLDAKDTFSKQRLFQNAWKELYPDHLEWVALSNGGKVTSVDVANQTLVTDFGNHKAAVANVIPPQKAGRIAEVAGVADATGWCPIDAATFESKSVPNIHVLGDAIIAGGMPKSAFSANARPRWLRGRYRRSRSASRRANQSSSRPATAWSVPTTASPSPAFIPVNGVRTDAGAGGKLNEAPSTRGG